MKPSILAECYLAVQIKRWKSYLRLLYGEQLDALQCRSKRLSSLIAKPDKKMLDRPSCALMRSRVIAFEGEFESTNKSLQDFGKEISRIELQRNEWLKSLHTPFDEESQLLKKKIQNMKAVVELLEINLMVDNARLKGFYKSQTVQYLVAATKPYVDGENASIRQEELDRLSRINIVELKEALQRSVAARSTLSCSVEQLSEEIRKLHTNYRQQGNAIAYEIRDRVTQYADYLRQTSIISKTNDRQITGDYLVLRHNSRVAAEIRAKNRMSADLASLALRESFDEQILANALEREKEEQSSESELQDLTDRIRCKLSTLERDLIEFRSRKNERVRLRKSKIQDLEMTISDLNRKYETLQGQRKNDLKRVGGELKRLREMVGTVEDKLLKLSGTADNDEYENVVNFKESRMLEKNSRAIIENLEYRLRLLRMN